MHNLQYLHFIKNARLKSIRRVKWYFTIAARPNHFRCRNIRTTSSHGMATVVSKYQRPSVWQHSRASPVYSFIMGEPTRSESNKFENIRNIFRADMNC